MFPKTYQFTLKKMVPRLHVVGKSEKYAKRLNPVDLYFESKNSHHYKPMTVRYLKYLRKVLRRRINIWSKEKIIYSCGKSSEKPTIDIKYLKNNLKCKDGSIMKMGHFAMRNDGDALNGQHFPNDCLLQVISAQTGIPPNKLRREITRGIRKSKSRYRMKNPIYHVLVSRFDDIIGGARYNGTSKSHAKRILDESQSGKSHPTMEAGHPRGHASYPKATGPKQSVEKYSETGRKTGFFSRSDQDLVAHYVLKTNESQDVMELLNERGKNGLKEVVKIPAKDLWIDEDELPQVQEWHNGEKIGNPGRIKDVVAVMKHHYEKYDDETADVFILTLYPRL